MSDYIPLELMPNILARLAVDDVVRCTSVCRSWYSLITSPSFASSHLNLSSPNQEPRLFIRHYNEHYGINYCLHRDNQAMDEITELDPPFDRDWDIVDCLNGLVCLHDKREGTIVLWNPSLRKSHILPNTRILSDSKYTVGFGFVATSNEFKILRFSSYVDKTEPEAEIYQLSTGSWRSLKLGDYFFVTGKSQAHLNGILHWYAGNSEKVNPTSPNLICSFDLKTEKFGALMVPSCLCYDDDASIIPYTFSESLNIVDFAVRQKCYKIWVMKEYGVADSWEKLVSIGIDWNELTNFPYFRHWGNLDLQNTHRERRVVLL